MLEEKKGRKREKQTNKRKLPAIGSRPRRSNCLPLKRKKKERRSHNRLDTWNTNLGIARDLRQIVRNNRRPEARGTNSGESRKGRQKKRRSTFRTVDPELLSGGCETTIRTKKGRSTYHLSELQWRNYRWNRSPIPRHTASSSLDGANQTNIKHLRG